MSPSFHIRRATVDDAGIIAGHRAGMFRDMGQLKGEAVEQLRRKAEARLREWIASAIYIGWLAYPEGDPATIVGGAGVQLAQILPRPVQETQVSEGRQGTIVNVFTDPAWRRKGVATALVKAILDWSRDQRLDRILLHASDEGRKVYSKLGFKESNEMRFVG